MGKSSDNEIPETAADKEAAKIAAEQWERFQTMGFKDIEDRFIETVQLDEGDAEVMRGRAAGSVGAAFDGATAQASEQLRQAGVAPGSGRFAATMNDLATERAASHGLALVDASEAVKTRSAQGIDAAISLGRGQAKEAQLGLEDIASSAAQKATNDAFTSAQRRATNQYALGQVAGAATAYAMKPGGIPAPTLDMDASLSPYQPGANLMQS